MDLAWSPGQPAGSHWVFPSPVFSSTRPRVGRVPSPAAGLDRVLKL